MRRLSKQRETLAGYVVLPPFGRASPQAGAAFILNGEVVFIIESIVFDSILFVNITQSS